LFQSREILIWFEEFLISIYLSSTHCYTRLVKADFLSAYICSKLKLFAYRQMKNFASKLQIRLNILAWDPHKIEMVHIRSWNSQLWVVPASPNDNRHSSEIWQYLHKTWITHQVLPYIIYSISLLNNSKLPPTIFFFVAGTPLSSRHVHDTCGSTQVNTKLEQIWVNS